MPGQPRLDAPGTLHHVMGRGIEAGKIFGNPGPGNRRGPGNHRNGSPLREPDAEGL
jgi:hypothetical protein